MISFLESLFIALHYPLSISMPLWFASSLITGIVCVLFYIGYDRLWLTYQEGYAILHEKYCVPSHQETTFIPLVNGLSVHMAPDTHLVPAQYRIVLHLHGQTLHQDVSDHDSAAMHVGDTVGVLYAYTRLTRQLRLKNNRDLE